MSLYYYGCMLGLLECHIKCPWRSTINRQQMQHTQTALCACFFVALFVQWYICYVEYLYCQFSGNTLLCPTFVPCFQRVKLAFGSIPFALRLDWNSMCISCMKLGALNSVHCGFKWFFGTWKIKEEKKMCLRNMEIQRIHGYPQEPAGDMDASSEENNLQPWGDEKRKLRHI